MALILPNRFYRQPTTTLIDQGNPITRGLNSGYLASTRSFFGATSPAQTSPNSTYRYDQRFGIATMGTIGATALATVFAPVSGSSDMTLLSVFFPATGVSETFPGNVGQTSSAMSFGLSVGNGTTNVIRGRCYLSGTRYFGGSTTITDFNKPIVAVTRQKVGVEQALFVNGVKDPTTTAFAGATFNTVNIGVVGAGANQAQFLVGLWGRALSDTEIWDLAQDPYQIFHRPNRRIWVDVVGGSPDVTVSATGQSIALSVGTLTPNNALAITGQPFALAQGSVTEALSLGLSGQLITLEQGAATSVNALALSGQSVVASQGSVSPSVGGDVSVSVSGIAIATEQGTLTSLTSKAATGQAIATAQGSVSQSRTLALSGQSVSTAQGVLQLGISVSELGQSIGVSQGNVTASAGSDITVAVTGQFAGLSQGSVIPANSRAVTGHAIGAEQGAAVPAISVASVGSFVSGFHGVVAPATLRALSGLPIVTAQGVATASSGGDVTVAVFGQSIFVTQSSLSTNSAATLQYPLAGLVQWYPLAGLTQY